MARPLYEIAREIRKTWTKVSPYAEPYLEAMQSLNTINDNYYFLSNANSWRGEDARRIKAELKEMLK